MSRTVGTRIFLAAAGVPNVHRLKVRSIGIVVPNTLDNGQFAIIEQLPCAGERGMQPRVVVTFEHVGGCDPKLGAGLTVPFVRL